MENNPLQVNILSNLPGVVIFSLDTQYCYTAFTISHSQIMDALWGVKIELGKNMLEYIQREDDREKAKVNFDRALRGETFVLDEEYGDETSHVRSWWEDRYSPCYDEAGNITGLTVFVLDVTRLKQIEKELQASELKYRSAIDQAGDAIMMADQSGRYLDVNHAACELLGYTREELLSLTIQTTVVGVRADSIRIDHLLDGKVIVREREMITKDGRHIPVEISAKMIEDGRLVGMVRDITKRREEEKRIRYLAFVMNKISSAVISTDSETRITHWNKGAELLYGWREEEVKGLLIDEVCGTEFSEEAQLLAREALLKDKTWHGELKQRNRTGEDIWVDASVTMLEDENGNFVGGVTINHDVTERKKAEEQLLGANEAIEHINTVLQSAFEREQLASRTDGLTSVFNRRYFFELLGYEFAASVRYRRPLTIVMFDVDFLKKINDTYGHLAGDEVLKKTAMIVHSELRQTDILARYGGDEFVILLANSDEQEAIRVLERIHHKIQSAKVVLGDKEIGITISAGIATFNPTMQKPDQLVMEADRALYAAKNAGRNKVFTSSANNQAEE